MNNWCIEWLTKISHDYRCMLSNKRSMIKFTPLTRFLSALPSQTSYLSLCHTSYTSRIPTLNEEPFPSFTAIL
jgi:hypothetical protein